VVDWDGDGTADEQDDWIELLNVGPAPADLSGWFLDNGEQGGASYTIPAGTLLDPGEYTVFYRRVTGIELNDFQGIVRLRGPGGMVRDSVDYPDLLGADQSYSRDESGIWHRNWPPSPGEPNQPAVP
jgi:hypothetical protein